MLKWKVCGMKYPQNILEVAALNPDFMGFIFYDKSPRYVGEDFEMPQLPSSIQKVGVFVNESLGRIQEIAQNYALDFIQLHGQEDAAFAIKVKEAGFGVIKAIGIQEGIDFSEIDTFTPYVDYLLLDTKKEGAYGGHGKPWNWELLKNAPIHKPFLQAGGISLENVEELFRNLHPNCVAMDVNSKFEIEKGRKNVHLLQKLKAHLEMLNRQMYF